MSKTNAPTFDIASHDTSTKGLKLGGTLVTASAAELNLMDGVTTSATKLNYLDVTTAGVAEASKAVVLGASKNIATITSATITTATSSNYVVAAGGKVTGDVGTGTCVSNAVTISKMAGIVTTESLTTAAGASQAIVITNTLVAAGDVVICQSAGGTSTRLAQPINAVCTANTITVQVYNEELVNALNGTVIFYFLVIKGS